MDTTLRPGQSLRLALRKGSRLLILQGSATVQEPPAWLADMLLLRPPQQLREGDAHVPHGPGVAVVTAVGDCRVLLMQPAGLWSRLLHHLGVSAAAASAGMPPGSRTSTATAR